MACFGQGLCDVVLAGHAHHQGAVGRIKRVITQHTGQRLQILLIGRIAFRHHPQQQILAQNAPRFPAIKLVGVMG